MIQAPESNDAIAPTWSNGGANLTAEYKNDKVALRWNAAEDNEGVYVYDVFRSSEGQPFERFHMSKSNHFYDTEILGGETLEYYVVGMDFAGNRTEKSNVVKVKIPEPMYLK